ANSGTVQARTLAEKEGRILLLADMSHGEVKHGGLLDASAPQSGDGGFIETSAATVTLEAGRKVTTLAANGQTGSWLIDPNDYTIAANGGNLSGAELSADLASTSVTISTATQGTAGGNGDIFVNDAVSWNAATTLTLNAQRNIELNAPITVANAGGGLALNYGGSDYSLGAPVSFIAGSGGSFSVNGQAYTLIHDMAALTAINSTGLSGRYALAKNLDAAGTTYSSALIGASSNSFTGTLAGLGHTISNLSINSVHNDTGLISKLGQYGRVRDIGLVDVNITAGSYSGALVGSADRARVDNVFVTGSVSGYYAGIIGGIVGYSYMTPITNAYFIGQVSGSIRVGGIVGTNYGTVANAYAVAQVSGTGAGVGPLMGYGDPLSNSFYATTDAGGNAISTSGHDNAAGTAKTYTELTQLSTFSGWDIDDAGASGRAWRIYDGNTLPLLRAFLTPVKVLVGDLGSSTYDGNGVSGTTNGYVVPNGVTLSGSGGTLSYSTGADARSYYGDGGSLNITGGYYSSQNGYDIIYDGSYTITPKAITVSADAASKTYGDADPTLGWTANGLVGSDTLGGSLSRVAGENAGSYAINQGTLANANYSITFTGNTLTITPKAITVSADAASKTYGDADPTLGWTANGLVGSDTLNGSLSRVAGENAGSYAINQGTLANANYSITFTGNTLTITPKAITVSADAASKTYGDADPTLGWTANGLVGSDTLGGSLSRVAGENAGSYAINQGTLANANYSITFTGNTLTITPKAITVSADAASKTYGDADPTLGWTANGLVGSDTLSGSVSRDAGENAGSYAINQGTLANANYSISFTGNTLTITPASLTVTASNASKTYDGLAWSGGNGVSYSGFVNGEDASVLSGALSYGGSGQGAVNAGSYGLSASGLTSGNYAISYVDGALTINKAVLTVTAHDASKRYDGQAWSGGNGVGYSGFVNGEDASVLSGSLAFGGSSQGATAAGNYTITPGGLGSGNYLIQFVDGQLQIGRAVTMDGGRVVSAIDPEAVRRAPTLPALAALMAGLGRTSVPLALNQDFIQLAR
ncbi:beta strand repeat-containing protein, partial [Azoarcus indigens]